MSKQDILQAKDEDLSRMAGEVLINENKAHEPNLPGHMCKRCFVSFRWPDSPAKDADCPAKNLIPLTPANAFKWRDWAVERYGEGVYGETIFMVVQMDNEFQIGHYQVSSTAQPKHFIKAAMLCKEQSND